jgi:hypothetical protein
MSAVATHTVHAELWTSLASLLRSYCAAHSLNRTQQAVCEVSADTILVRVATRWMRLSITHDRGEVEFSSGSRSHFTLHDNGTVSIGAHFEELDHFAERLAREIVLGHPHTHAEPAQEPAL